MSTRYLETYRAFRRKWARSRASHKSGGRIRLDRNTYLEWRSNGLRAESYAVRLHATDIAVFHADGSVTVDSGGWSTVTTLDRLRHVCGIRVASERGVWTFGRWEFQRGMTLHPDGSATGPDGGPRSAASALSEARMMWKDEKNTRARQRRADRKEIERRRAEWERKVRADRVHRWGMLSVSERLAARLEGCEIPQGCAIDAPTIQGPALGAAFFGRPYRERADDVRTARRYYRGGDGVWRVAH